MSRVAMTGLMSLGDYFERFAGLRDPYLAFDDGYRSWSYSYAQVGAAARNFAAQLQAEGIKQGETIIFWSENRPEWVAAFWGCAIAGVIVVPIDYRAPAEFVFRVQRQVRGRLVLLGEEVAWPQAEGSQPVQRFSEFDWAGTKVPLPVQLQPNDVAEIVFTSGSTGEPKGVLITHRNILSNLTSPERIVTSYVKYFRPVFPLRFLSLVPLSHMFGQAVTLFILPLLPGTAVFMRGFSPHEIVRQIQNRRISVAIVVPKLLEVLREYVEKQFPEASTAPPPGIHWTRRWWIYRSIHQGFGWKFWAFIAGAAPLASELEEFWSRLGFVVVQGYGLTETAPIVSFNNPFAVKKGTVGRPVEGTEIKIAPDGEILVRGNSVTPGYYGVPAEADSPFSDGWLHTGDLGEIDANGCLTIRGRKKEMIVTPEGLNVFPEDIERVLNCIPGVHESAVVGRDHPHAVLVLEPGVSPEEVTRAANLQLQDHQKLRGVSVWPFPHLPRTTGTEKIKRVEVQRWIDTGTTVSAPAPSGNTVLDLVRRYAPGRRVTEDTTLDQLGLSSLDRVELMIDLEQHLDASIDESALASSETVGTLSRIARPAAAAPAPETLPRWNISRPAQWVRHTGLALLWLPLTRLIARCDVRGQEHLASLQGPVIFVPNHQSHFDTPCILAAIPRRYRYRTAVAMWKEFFDPHFHPERHSKLQWLGSSMLYWLIALFFNAFPLPQAETGAGGSLRYLGSLISNGWSVLYFPEGARTKAGEIQPFQPGIGLIADKLRIQIVPIRLRGFEKIMRRGQYFPRPGRVEIIFGAPMLLRGDDYAGLARKIEQVIREQ